MQHPQTDFYGQIQSLDSVRNWSLQLVCYLANPYAQGGQLRCVLQAEKRQELELSLLFSTYPNAIHKTAGKLRWELHPQEVQHVISPYQLHSSSSVSPGHQAGPQGAQACSVQPPKG